MEHINWWNKLPKSEREEIALKHFERSSDLLTDSDIFKAYHNLHFLLEPEKVKELTEEEKIKLRKYDRLTTLLGLTTTLRDFFEMSAFLEEGLFEKQLKLRAKFFQDELILTMNRYYNKDDKKSPKKETKEHLEKRLAEKKERNELQMNQLNL
jgi:hypothetical protein